MNERMRFAVALVLAAMAVGGAAKNMYDEYAGAGKPEAAVMGPWAMAGLDELDEDARQEIAAAQAQHEALAERMLEEQRHASLGFLVALFWVWEAFPVAALAGLWRFRHQRLASTYFGLLVFYAGVYAFYAMNGPSEGAGRLHFFLLPAILAITSALFVLYGTLRMLAEDHKTRG